MKKQQGFSIVEVLVALAIVAIAIAPIAGLSCGQRKMAKVNDVQLEALSLAEQVLDELAPIGFDKLVKLSKCKHNEAASNLWPIQHEQLEVSSCWSVVDETGLGRLTVVVKDKKGKVLRTLTKLIAKGDVSLSARPSLNSNYKPSAV